MNSVSGLNDAEIRTERLLIRVLKPSDVTDRYVKWLNDPAVNRFIESRFYCQNMTTVRSFVESMNDSPTNILFGIFVEPDGCHIGNIRLGPIEQIHGRANIGMLIGERGNWGKGYASEAICGVSRFAFEYLGLDRLHAGIYAENEGSRRAFLKAGWKEEGRLYGHLLCEGRRQDAILLGLLRD